MKSQRNRDVVSKHGRRGARWARRLRSVCAGLAIAWLSGAPGALAHAHGPPGTEAPGIAAPGVEATAFEAPLAAPRTGGPVLATMQTAHYLIEYAPGLEGHARTLAQVVERHHARIYGELSLPVAQPETRVTILADEASMLAEAARRHGGQRPPEWAAGLAYPASREIFLHAGVEPAELDRTFQHEISHVALGALVGKGRVPTWFSEAIAIKQSEGFALERAWLLTQAATMDGLLHLSELERGFPASGGRAGVAYAQAVHFVGYLQQQFGPERFAALLNRLREADGQPFADAFEATYGQTLLAVETDWRGSLKLWWGWIPVVFGSATAWLLATAMLVWGWRRRRRQQAARLQTLRATEAVEMAEDIEVAGGFQPPPAVVDPYAGRPPTLH